MPFNPTTIMLRRLTMGPIPMPAPLVQKLAKGNPGIIERILQKDLTRLRAADLPFIDAVDTDGSALFKQPDGKSQAALKQWKEYVQAMRDVVQYGWSGAEETIVAMILAGGGMARQDIDHNKLRADLSSKFKQACIDEHKKPINGTPHALVHAYKKLCGKSNASTHLSVKVKEILEGTAPLRLGRELAELDPDKIEASRKKYFARKHQRNIAGKRTGRVLKDKTLTCPQLTAPDKMELVLKSVHCEKTQEKDKDEVYCLSYFTAPEDPKALYDAIDAAIKADTLTTFDFKVVPKVEVQLTKVEVVSAGQTINYNATIGQLDMVQGFGPWHCHVDLYEDDDQEYKALQEVFDQIAAYAQLVAQGAEFVASVSGPSYVAAGAAVVATIAEYVRIAAKVGSAITRIVNWVDEDDLLGTASTDGRGDYVRVSAGTYAFPAQDVGLYDVVLEEKLIGQEVVTRNWEVQQTNGKGPKRSFKSTFGTSEDYNVEFKLDASTQKIVNFGIDHVCVDKGVGGDKGWSKWKAGPNLLIDQRTIVGSIHVGQNGLGEVSITPWVQGIGLLDPL